MKFLLKSTLARTIMGSTKWLFGRFSVLRSDAASFPGPGATPSPQQIPAPPPPQVGAPPVLQVSATTSPPPSEPAAAPPSVAFCPPDSAPETPPCAASAIESTSPVPAASEYIASAEDDDYDPTYDYGGFGDDYDMDVDTETYALPGMISN